MIARRWVRGGAMVETAVTLSLTMLVLYGAFDLGLMGYFQLQLDGATFFYTHAYASGASASSSSISKYGTQLAALFPNVATAQMSPQPAAPPATDEPVNYIQWGPVDQRFGGASVLRPQRLMTTATYQVTGSTWSAIFPHGSHGITLSAGNVDARPTIGNHDDDAQGVDYNSSTANSSLIDPLTGDDQNTPPYYFSNAFMTRCNRWNKDGTCDSDNVVVDSLGMAEYLKHENYSSAFPNNGIDQGGTFEYVKYHQQVYATLSAAIALLPSDITLASTTWNASVQPELDDTIEKWDVQAAEYLPSSSAQLGEQYPLHPGIGCSWC